MTSKEIKEVRDYVEGIPIVGLDECVGTVWYDGIAVEKVCSKLAKRNKALMFKSNTVLISILMFSPLGFGILSRSIGFSWWLTALVVILTLVLTQGYIMLNVKDIVDVVAIAVSKVNSQVKEDKALYLEYFSCMGNSLGYLDNVIEEISEPGEVEGTTYVVVDSKTISIPQMFYKEFKVGDLLELQDGLTLDTCKEDIREHFMGYMKEIYNASCSE